MTRTTSTFFGTDRLAGINCQRRIIIEGNNYSLP